MVPAVRQNRFRVVHHPETTMQSITSLDEVGTNLAPRLAQIGIDLGISGPQWTAWDRFVEHFDAILRMINTADVMVATTFADRAPSMPSALGVQVYALSKRLRAARLLEVVTGRLYRSLTTRQRKRADRLLPTVLPVFSVP